ncbi:hypothetical protein [Ancylobacter amanitiformis]|uniref:DUF3883 domain-containing protein n=1 Tax=Ancylobacter amanitiformis TaxID=217069 RepID=A0ABU0LWF8_9HYPH|nr:hypothetical protein [Ancylobacter amanitiformis]MDQ0513014.1 hypothetical protein [Ancylobacter amanitiformis]
MSQADAWSALSGLIKGLQGAGELHARFHGYHRPDSYGAEAYLGEQCTQAVIALERFRQEFTQSLPDIAAQRIDFFLKERLGHAEGDGQTIAPQTVDPGSALVGLVALEAEITFILRGRQEQIRARSERAFLFLQRALAVDNSIRAKWQAAFDKGEVACERLGSLALLSQGIYAFKVDALGARTDLVFTAAPEDSLLSRGVDGLVLTEWKVADARNAKARFIKAREQAELYRQVPLAGSELTVYRYLIAVSEKELPRHTIPSDWISPAGVTYRHINIAVAPDVPSKASKRK